MKYFTLILIVLLIVSCSEKNNNTTNYNKNDTTIIYHGKIQPVFKISSFPLNVGNWWRYQVEDFLNSCTDTILVKVVSLKTTGTENLYTCHVELFNEIIDSALITLSDSVISYKTYNNVGYSYFAEFYLKYPIAYGYAWHGINQNDSFSVAPYHTDTEILGKQYKTYFINRYFLDYNYYHIQAIMISENIGIVHENTSIRSYPYDQQQGFDLIDYHLE